MDFLRQLLGMPTNRDMPSQSSLGAPTEMPTTVSPRVLLIIHNPILRTQGNQTLQHYFRWNDPDRLAKEYANDVRWCSYGYVDYQIVQRIEADSYSVKRDGYAYTEESFLKAWRERRFHDPDGVDYLRLVHEFDMMGKVSRDEIDEVWLMGFPYQGYYESIMAGPGAFWCNAPPLAGTESCKRRFVIMGFNYERGVGEMLEDLGHRAESILSRVFQQTRGDANLWKRFTRYDLKYPGQAEVGNVHFAPNSERDYDWGNHRQVLSHCDNWYYFPNLSGSPRWVTCSEWGNGDIREHHRWWLRHLPHIVGEANGISHNWWEYIIDPNRVR